MRRVGSIILDVRRLCDFDLKRIGRPLQGRPLELMIASVGDFISSSPIEIRPVDRRSLAFSADGDEAVRLFHRQSSAWFAGTVDDRSCNESVLKAIVELSISAATSLQRYRCQSRRGVGPNVLGARRLRWLGKARRSPSTAGRCRPGGARA